MLASSRKAKISRTTPRSGQLNRKRAFRKPTDPIPRLRKKIEQAFGANKFRNPCVIKRCHAKFGYGVFARRDLKRGALVAYYVIKLVKAKARSPTQDVYKTCAPAWTRMPNSCRLWGRRGTSWSRSRTLEGDIGQDAGDVFGRYVFRGKPVCGHVINEPGEKETQNCVMPTTVWEASLFKQGDGRIRGTFKAGDVVFHEIRTLRSVKKGEELMTMYDDDYERDYKQGKKFEGADFGA